MANDELMRLAERVEALATDWTSIEEAEKRDAIAADLRALAQRAPQNSDHKALGVLTDDEAERLVANVETLVGMGAGAWDTIPAREIARAFAQLLNKPGVTAPEGWALVPRVMTVEMDIAFCEVWFSRRRAIDDSDTQDALDAALAAAPAPDHSADAGKMVGEPVLDREYVERTQAKSRNWQGQISVNASALAELCRVYLAQLNAPEAERAKGETVASKVLKEYWDVRPADPDLHEDIAAMRIALKRFGLLSDHPAPPPAGQPEGVEALAIACAASIKGKIGGDAREFTFIIPALREFARRLASAPQESKPDGVDDYKRIYAEVIQVCADQPMAHEIASRLASAQQAGKDGA